MTARRSTLHASCSRSTSSSCRSTFCDQRLLRDGTLAELHEEGVELHARSTFLQGLLLMETDDLPARLAKAKQPLHRYHEARRRLGLTPIEAALGFASSVPGVDVALVGANSVARARRVRPRPARAARPRYGLRIPGGRRSAPDRPAPVDAVSELRLGLLGLSEGNGHPYSWAAIVNGYDRGGDGHAARSRRSRATCPSIASPRRRSRTRESRTSGRRTRRSPEQIAAACRIEHVVSDPAEMLGEVDAVLLARDDAERHAELAGPFLDAGLPIYIDKPLATERRRRARPLRAAGLRGAALHLLRRCATRRSCASTPATRESIGPIGQVLGSSPKRWSRYAVHLIEPALVLIGDAGEIRSHQRPGGGRHCPAAGRVGFGRTGRVRDTGRGRSPDSAPGRSATRGERTLDLRATPSPPSRPRSSASSRSPGARPSRSPKPRSCAWSS